MRLRVLGMLGLCWLGVGQAELYRCEVQGQVIYTDRGCDVPVPAYQPRTPLNPLATVSAPDLARAYDQRTAREHAEYLKANAAWLQRQAEEKAQQEQREREDRERFEHRNDVDTSLRGHPPRRKTRK
jgi:hypothetical protein